MRLSTDVVSRLRPGWLIDSHPPAAESSQILIADDEANSRLGFRVTLEAAGYEVTEATDGAAALESLRDDPADLVLLDLRMPGMDGMEVLERLRSEAIAVPVVVVTAHDSVPSAVRAIDLGAIDFLAKPVKPATLRQTVLEILGRRADAGTDSYRLGPTKLGAEAHRFTEILAVARRVLKHGHYDLTEYLLQQALDLAADSAEAHTLMGIVRESCGQVHAAYHSYKRALEADAGYAPAKDRMRRYCERFGIDCHNKAIYPGVD